VALRPIVIPLDGGHDTTVDKRLAGLARFRSVVNGRLDADGRIVSRPRYQQLGTTTYGSGTFAAYDLFELDGRLCALGDRLSLGHPTDIFEHTPTGGAVWRPTDAVTSSIPRLPRGTGLREMPRPPDQEGGVSSFDVAAAGGYVLLVYQQSTAGGAGYAQVIAAAAAQTLLVRRLTGTNEPARILRAVGLTTRLWMVGARPDLDEIRAERIDPASATSWTAAGAALITTSGHFTLLDAAKVGGTDAFVVAAYDDNGRLRVRRFDSSGTVIAPSGGQYADVTGLTATRIAVEADTTGNTVNVAVTDSGTLKVYSYNLATGATLGSPPFTPAEAVGQTATNVSIVRASSTTVQVLATITSFGTPDVPRVVRWIYTTAAQTFGADAYVEDSMLASMAVQPGSSNVTAVFGIVRGDADTTPNMLVEHGSGGGSNGTDVVAPIATKDLGIASAPLALTPHIGIDTSQTPTRYYWAHAVEGNDGATSPVVCEIQLTSTARRQMARVGRGAVIAGACPVWYDGVELVELGFTQRPSVINLDGSNGSGTLFGGATYTYSAIQTWFDALGRLHRSPAAVPEEVELAAADDTVSVDVRTAITLRHNIASAPYGSTVRDELYRTRVIQTKTAAELTSSAVLDPPSSSLNTLTFILMRITVGTGFAAYTTTFDATSDDSATIASQIDAVIAGATASAASGFLTITHDTPGEEGILIVGNGTANSILGFVAGTREQGTTENERGEVLHFTDAEYHAIGGDSGGQQGITDTRDDGTADTGLASQAVIYTQIESPLDDHAPPPADYVWSGNERLWLAGLPNRAAWRASKLIDEIRAPAFAAEGRLAFGGELADSIEAVVAQDVSELFFTRRGIWQVDGEGPAENGQGKFFAARRVFTESGLVADGWRSLLETEQGIWCQLGSDKLYLVKPGAGAEWAGFPIRELLRSFPVIVAATLTHNDQMAAFALQASDGLSGRIALFDLRRKVWMVDDVSVVPTALADYQGRLVFADTTRAVWMADATAGSGTFVPLTVETGHATEFDVAGQGRAPHVLLVGLLSGECTLLLEVDYDDGQGFVSAGTFALTVAGGYTVGQTVTVEFDLAGSTVTDPDKVTRFALRMSTSGSSGSAGFAPVAIVAFAEKEQGIALLGDRFRR